MKTHQLFYVTFFVLCGSLGQSAYTSSLPTPEEAVAVFSPLRTPSEDEQRAFIMALALQTDRLNEALQDFINTSSNVFAVKILNACLGLKEDINSARTTYASAMQTLIASRCSMDSTDYDNQLAIIKDTLENTIRVATSSCIEDTLTHLRAFRTPEIRRRTPCSKDPSPLNLGDILTVVSDNDSDASSQSATSRPSSTWQPSGTNGAFSRVSRTRAETVLRDTPPVDYDTDL